MAEVAVVDCGQLRTSDLYSLLNDHREDLRMVIIQLLQEEAMNPTSPFIEAVRSVMNTIADEEIEKVLKN